MPGASRLLDEGIDFRAFPARFPKWFKRSPEFRRAISRRMPETDILHIHALYLYTTIVSALIAERCNVPYLIRPCGALDPYHARRKSLKKYVVGKLLHDHVLRHAAAFQFTTDAERSLAEPYIFARPTVVIPNGIDLAEFASMPPRGQFGLRHPEKRDRLIILSFGRINYKKGFELLIPAFAKLLQQNPQTELVIAGPDDGYGRVVQSLITIHGVSSNVTFLGLLTGPERLQILADADIFVLPSHAENFSNALFEAMAAGLPVVISNNVMTANVVEEARAGLIVPNHVDAIAEAVSRLLTSAALRRDMGDRGSALVRQRYSWDRAAEQLELAYMSVLSRH